MGGLSIGEEKGMRFYIDEERRLVRTIDEGPEPPARWRLVSEEEYKVFRRETAAMTPKKLRALRAPK